jgi:hypothetical protein
MLLKEMIIRPPEGMYTYTFFFLETPETAFIYALTSAAVMHSIAKACSKGELTECGCDKSQPTTRSRTMLRYSSTPPSINRAVTTSSNDGFEWGGCSDDLKFGRNVSMSFIDKQEMFITRRRIVRMVNLHNNEAGRKVIEIKIVISITKKFFLLL